MVMKYKPVFLPLANNDIIRIDEALSDYPDKTRRIFMEMDKKVALLEDMPYMWPVYQANQEYRRMIIEDHLLFYKVDEGERKIKIYRVLYNKMNISEHLE